MKKRIHLGLLFVISICIVILFFLFSPFRKKEESVNTDYGEVEYSDYISEFVQKGQIREEQTVDGEIVGNGKEIKVKQSTSAKDYHIGQEDKEGNLLLEKNMDGLTYLDFKNTYIKVLMDNKYQKYLGRKIKITIHDGDKQVDGEILKVSGQLEDEKIALYLKNPFHYLLGTKLSVNLLFSKIDNAITIDRRYLQNDDSEYFIEVMENEKVKKIVVEPGLMLDDMCELKHADALEGQEIVISKYEYMQETEE